jgi:hypothetical protein
MKPFWENATAIVGLGSFAFGIAYYTLRLESRVDTLETQIRTLSTAPAIIRKPAEDSSTKERKSANAGAKGEASADTSGVVTSTYSDYPVQNPLVATCLDLVQRAVKARENSQTSFALSLEQYQKDYGCAQTLRRGDVKGTDYYGGNSLNSTSVPEKK